ncbi:hypothetical protein GCM10022200_15700 [Microbacterium awajiense]|uniref:Lipoprotein n=1 Tax=Microbacterium awajiense TaxID=415214 RepID=A0ABP7AII1_9MICO
MTDISRRTATAFLALGPALALAACTQERTAAERTGAHQTLGTTTAWSTTKARPAALLSTAEFGPTGRHWPSRTPRPTDRFTMVLEVDASWTAIAAAITRAVDEQPNGRVAILVRPGTLPGYGAGSTARAVLKGVGAAGRKYRILVAPRDGAGTVQHSASLRLELVSGVSFMGFWPYPYSVVMSAVTDVAWGWSKVQALNITGNSATPVDDVELVECVTPEAQLKDSDTWAFRTVDRSISNVSMIGCYVSPSYKQAGSSAHCDTLQLSGNSANTGLVIRDSVIFASTNAAFIPSGAATGVIFDHSLVVGGDRMLERYPLPSGANAFTSGFPQAVNGSGSVDQLSGADSVFIGGVSGTWLDVKDCTVSGTRAPTVTTGGFTSDPALSGIDDQWLESMAPMPSDDRLRAAWSV